MRRFYKSVTVAAEGQGWRVALDGRAIKTVAGRPQLVPTAALAEAMAAEWAAQGEEIDPAAFVLRDMADYALDVVATDRDAAIASLLRFAETDTLCYRAEDGEPLLERQQELWEPLLTAAEARWDIHFERIGGIIHRPQPAETLKRLRGVLAALDDFTLAALNTLASLSASLVIGLAALEDGAEAEALWALANLEEDWQADLWGKDYEYLERRERRLGNFSAAINFAQATRG